MVLRDHRAVTAVPGGALARLEPAATMGIGSLPHRDARQAAEFALDAFDVPTIPSLPRRSAAELPISQALTGVQGVSVAGQATITVEGELDPDRAVHTDITADQFGGFRAFLDTASGRGLDGPVAWHFTGPISAGVALWRAGVAPQIAFDTALAAVRSHLRSLVAEVSSALPESPQLVFIDEPFADQIMARDFPISPDQCIDLVSSAMAAVEPIASVGVHCCRKVDASLLLEAGPHVLSFPVSEAVIPLAGYIDQFLAGGGWIAWGAVATGGPVGVTANRSWHQLSTLWGELARRGCAPRRLRDQSLLTPECGLGAHGVTVADKICHSLRDIRRSARSDSATTKLLLGV